MTSFELAQLFENARKQGTDSLAKHEFYCQNVADAISTEREAKTKHFAARSLWHSQISAAPTLPELTVTRSRLSLSEADDSTEHASNMRLRKSNPSRTDIRRHCKSFLATSLHQPGVQALGSLEEKAQIAQSRQSVPKRQKRPKTDVTRNLMDLYRRVFE